MTVAMHLQGILVTDAESLRVYCIQGGQDVLGALKVLVSMFKVSGFGRTNLAFQSSFVKARSH